jgi:hypothetical protein
MVPMPVRVLTGAAVGLAVAACSGDDSGEQGSSGAGGQSAFAFTSEPEGCGYSIGIDASRGTDFVIDDAKLGTAPTPQRVRLGLGGSTKLGADDYADPSTTAALLWDTDVATTATKVRMGAAPTDLTRALAGFSYLLPGTVPMRVHRADACGLEPKTTYYYQVGGGPDGTETWSETRSFTTLAGPDDAEVALGVTGDSRDSLDVVWPLVQGRMAKAGIDFQVFTGDSIQLAVDASETYYASWFDGMMLGGSLGAMPVYAIGGNHENVQAQWLANHGSPGEGLTQGLYASFDVGPVHVVVFDDQVVASATPAVGFPDTIGTAVRDWLESDLAAADARRDVVPWIIVVNHRGVLSTSKHAGDADVVALRKIVMPIYDSHHVDLVLNGHDHNYERSKPATGPADAPAAQTDFAKGTVYVVCAGAGASAYSKGEGDVAYREINAGFGEGTPYVGVYGLLSISSTTLKWTAYGLTMSGANVADDGVIDQVTWSK